jgi:hypothetical protein
MIIIFIILLVSIITIFFIVKKNDDCTPIMKEVIGDYELWTVSDTCKEGMPHTIDKNTIIFPKYLHNIPKLEKDMIINHEKVHLEQRRNINKWNNFYNKFWNYKVYSHPPGFIPKNLVKNKRDNPDTSDFPWACWDNTWWSIPIYTDNTLKNAKVVWYNQKNNNIYNEPPVEWTNFFNSNNIITQSEHPNEISAVYIGKNNFTTNAGKLLYEFIKNNK